VTFNKAAEEMWDCAKESAMGQLFTGVLAEHERARMMKTFSYVIRTENALRATGVSFVNRAGRMLYINCYAALFRNAAGEKLGVIMWTEDVTEEKKLEEENKMASMLNEIVIESIGTGIIAVDLEGKILKINQAAQKMYALEDQEPVGKTFLYGLAEHERTRFKKTHDFVVRTGKVFKGSEIKLMNRLGKTIYINAYSSLIRSPAGEKQGIAMLTEDITHRKQLEAEVQRADKLAALGQLALGISHEIRTPLGTIKTLATLVKEDLTYENCEKSLTYLQVITNEIDRLEYLSHELLDFAGKSKPGTQSVNINEILSKVIYLGKLNKPNRKISVRQTFQADLPDVRGDRNMLLHAFLNLFMNAIEATEDNDNIEMHTFHDNGWVYISVADTGIGISKESLDKIFDPFYSTKDYGTGLGLSILHTIVKNHRGYITVESSENAGTVFTVRLPVEGGASAI
jgi:two-component system sensor histidine kinase AtoS